MRRADLAGLALPAARKALLSRRFGDRWYVSFPPFPAVVLVPFVAVWGTHVWDRLIWAILAGLAPALTYVFLRRLRETGRSERGVVEDLTNPGGI